MFARMAALTARDRFWTALIRDRFLQQGCAGMPPYRVNLGQRPPVDHPAGAWHFSRNRDLAGGTNRSAPALTPGSRKDVSAAPQGSAQHRPRERANDLDQLPGGPKPRGFLLICPLLRALAEGTIRRDVLCLGAAGHNTAALERSDKLAVEDAPGNAQECLAQFALPSPTSSTTAAAGARRAAPRVGETIGDGLPLLAALLGLAEGLELGV